MGSALHKAYGDVIISPEELEEFEKESFLEIFFNKLTESFYILFEKFKSNKR